MQATRICHISTEKVDVEREENNTAVPASMVRFEVEEEGEGKKDPLKMFAILPPQSLRDAQKEAVRMVDVVPRIVEVEWEMAEVEIRVRRARKYLVKAKEGKGKAEGVEEEVEEDVDVQHITGAMRKTAVA